MSLDQPQLTYQDVPATVQPVITDPKFDEAIVNILKCQTKEELYKNAKSYCNWYERTFTRGKGKPRRVPVA